MVAVAGGPFGQLGIAATDTTGLLHLLFSNLTATLPLPHTFADAGGHLHLPCGRCMHAF
jgi:hypothetical protein